MSKKNNRNKVSTIMQVGNFTKNAIEDFEENIVSKKDYLEKVKENQET